ncbi:hypothetical protein PAHAL_7G345400 [Panicum hallii]|jgi:MAP kinase substrate 1|uniref:VQ domain-containing protein n=1 Tax=Panicum hallii TaxID=206008 RepID=A0A2T8IEE8_9POAL|nr:uncharacterized protein LOC112901423 [Panicum hallii]PVH36054.1 hypothetical protein PAHAL_7G345400 [Panicum hallii]
MPSHSPAAVSPSTMQRHHGLQGPRPATLKVTNKADLQGRKKRPVQQQQQQPVIIYVESPKVVHAQPSEFKSVVQRLTGAPPPSSSSSMLLSSASSLLPLQPQFPLQLYGQLPLVASSSLWSTTTTVAAAPATPAASCLPADAAASIVRSLGFFISDDQLMSPAAFLYDHQSRQSMMAAAGPAGAAVQTPNPLLVPSSLGACYQGDLFVNQQ